MPQNVPTFDFTENALRVRAFVFDFWCEQGRGPRRPVLQQLTD